MLHGREHSLKDKRANYEEHGVWIPSRIQTQETISCSAAMCLFYNLHKYLFACFLIIIIIIFYIWYKISFTCYGRWPAMNNWIIIARLNCYRQNIGFFMLQESWTTGFIIRILGKKEKEATVGDSHINDF